MGLQHQVKGVGNRSGIFWAGRPTTMLAFDDAIVLLPSSTLGGFLATQGAIGAAVGAVSDKRKAADREGKADELDAAQFADAKRATVIPYGEITAAHLKSGRMQNKITLETAGGSRYLRYPKKLWPDGDISEFMSARVGERFAPAET
jgi:hypothetical protein